MSKTNFKELAKPKETKIMFNLSHGEKKLLKDFAKRAGVSMSAYIRLKTVYEPAQRQEHQLDTK